MKNLLILIISLFCLPFNIAAQVGFTVNSPTIVAVNEPFRVEFAANEKVDNFEAPSFDGFNVIAGPTVSEGTNIEYVNGKLSKSKLFTYTYVLVAQKEGNTQIGAATASIEGKKYSTKPVPIDVAKERGSSGNDQNNRGNGTSQRQASSLASDDVLLRTIVTRRSVYKGEPILVQLKLYTRAQIAQFTNFRPAAFNGFWKQEVPIAEQQDPKRETFNGKIYDTAVIREFLVFPQKSGQLEVEQMDLGVVAVVLNEMPQGGNSILESFFGGGQSYQNVELNLKSIPVKIDVKELPSGAPANFSGAVGSFSLTGKLNENKISANGSSAIVLRLSGSGNFPLISTPKIDLPGSFELYPSKTRDEYTVNSRNIEGDRTFEYPFIARAEGEFTLPAIEFSYFDPAGGNYVTLSTPTFPIDVLKDVSGSSNSSGNIISGVSKEELKILGKDIHFIKIGSGDLSKNGAFLLGSWIYILSLIISIALFVSVLIYMNKRIKELRDTVKLKNKKANKVALARLKAARKFKSDNMENEFYSEMLRALTGYVGDKLNIEVARLSKEYIRQQMESKSVSNEDIDQLLQTITDCEFAQYSPSASVKMSDVYQSTLQLIGRLESKL